MVDVKELRIGNWVSDHLARWQQVADIRAEEGAYICYNQSNKAKLKYKLNTTNPILLNEEILLGLGFEVSNFKKGCFYLNGRLLMPKQIRIKEGVV